MLILEDVTGREARHSGFGAGGQPFRAAPEFT
jgi:hypothetical protein